MNDENNREIDARRTCGVHIAAVILPILLRLSRHQSPQSAGQQIRSSFRLRVRNCSTRRMSGSAPSSDVDRRSRTRLWCRTRSVPKRCRVRHSRPNTELVCCASEGVLTHRCLTTMIPQGVHPIASPAGKTEDLCGRSAADNAPISTGTLEGSTSYEDGFSRR